MRAMQTRPAPLERTNVPTRAPGAPVQRPGRLVEAARIFLALYFIAMALGVNALYLLRHPEQFDGLADLAVLPPYEWLLREVIPPLATPFTLLLVGFELTVALLMLGKGRAVTLGLAAAIAFQLAVIPGVGAYGLANLPVVALMAVLLRVRYGRTALDLARSRRRAQPGDDALRAGASYGKG